MTALELLYTFENKARLHSKLQNISIPTSDIEMYLNNAQELLIKKYFETFDTDAESRIFLQKLIKVKRFDNTEYFTDVTNFYNGYYFTLPSDVKFIIKGGEEVSITKDTLTYRPRVKIIENIYSNLNDNDPFRKPYENMVWRTSHGLNSNGDEAKTHEIIIGDGFSINYYWLRYLKYPTSINFDTNTTTELDETIHQELIDTAIDLAVKSKQTNLELQKQL